MELDALKDRWADHDRKLDDLLRVNRSLIRESRLGRMGSALKRDGISVAIELAMNVVLLLLLGSFIADHIRQPLFLVPALQLHIMTILMTGSGVRQLMVQWGTDYSRPVLEIQRSLEELRVLKLRVTKWVLVLAPLAWAPLWIVSFKGLFGLDVYAMLGLRFVAANYLVGFLAIPVLLWIAHQVGDRRGRSRLVAGFLDDIAGRNLNRAVEELKALSDFEKAV